MDDRLKSFQIDRSSKPGIDKNSILDLMLNDFESCFLMNQKTENIFNKTFASGTLVTVINNLATVADIRTERMIFLHKYHNWEMVLSISIKTIPEWSKLLSKTYWNIEYWKNEIKEGRDCFEIPNW